jgi:hypothetical protein
MGLNFLLSIAYLKASRITGKSHLDNLIKQLFSISYRIV